MFPQMQSVHRRTGGPIGPAGSDDALLLADGVFGLLLADGTSFLLLAI